MRFAANIPDEKGSLPDREIRKLFEKPPLGLRPGAWLRVSRVPENTGSKTSQIF